MIFSQYDAHSKPLFIKLHISDLQKLIIYRISLMMYKLIIIFNCSQYLLVICYSLIGYSLIGKHQKHNIANYCETRPHWNLELALLLDEDVVDQNILFISSQSAVITLFMELYIMDFPVLK